MQSAKPKNQHSFPRRTSTPDELDSFPEATAYIAYKYGGSLDT